jgi:hypothetical protein
MRNMYRMNPHTMPLELTNIYKYCNTTSKSVHGGLNPYASPCFIRKSIPISKTTKLKSSTNTTGQSKKMAYSQWVNTYGTAQSSGPALKKTCWIGTNMFTY